MSKVFISYRRDQDSFPAGALGRALRAHFGEAQVFRDKEDLDAGTSWRDQIARELAGSAVLLVLIGKNWATVADSSGRPRLQAPDDPVANEIRAAVACGARVIPVLLENAEIPSGTMLPGDLAFIGSLQAARLRDSDWSEDVKRLCLAIERRGLQVAEPVAPGADKTPLSRKAVVGLVSGILAASGPWTATDPEGFGGAVFLALLGMVLGAWAFTDVRRKSVRGRAPAVAAVVVSVLALPVLFLNRAPAPASHALPSRTPIQPCGCVWQADHRAPEPRCSSGFAATEVCPSDECPNGAPMTRVVCE